MGEGRVLGSISSNIWSSLGEGQIEMVTPQKTHDPNLSGMVKTSGGTGVEDGIDWGVNNGLGGAAKVGMISTLTSGSGHGIGWPALLALTASKKKAHVPLSFRPASMQRLRMSVFAFANHIARQ